MDIGIQEILLISVIALIILGPERLPEAVRTIAVWLGRIRRSFNEIKTEIEREIDADEIKRQIHNEDVLHELAKTQHEVGDAVEAINEELRDVDRSLSDSTQASSKSSEPSQ